MKAQIIGFVICTLLGTAIGLLITSLYLNPTPTTTAAPNPEPSVAELKIDVAVYEDKVNRKVHRYVDKETGIFCYQTTMYNLSCTPR